MENKHITWRDLNPKYEGSYMPLIMLGVATFMIIVLMIATFKFLYLNF